MRVSLGFTPKWYRDRLGIDFGEAWHLDPGYRYEQSLRMRELLSDLFPTVDYFKARFREGASDGSGHFCPECATISSVLGIMLMSSCYGLPLSYRCDNWPDAAGGAYLPREALSSIIAGGPFDFTRPETLPGGGVTVKALFAQVEEIHRRWGPVHGYLNYQGILNIALKLRGNDLFIDMFDDPGFGARAYGQGGGDCSGTGEVQYRCRHPDPALERLGGQHERHLAGSLA
jgi:hypothetical protein